MIRFYCRWHEGNKTLCPACRETLRYAQARLDRCRYGSAKPSCRQCPVHCYKPDMRARMQKIMRWTGPRMIFFLPLATFRHWLGK
jgi:predicted amidophosphoribosyltransferase